MPNPTLSKPVADYVAKRAELLARLALTRQKDVRLLGFEADADIGLDFLVQLPSIGEPKGLPILPCIGIEVIGTDEPLETEDQATAYANRHRKERPKGFF